MADELKVVLIAEDEPDNREILRAVVEDILGYEAVLVEDGATALEVVDSRRPSLVLMDLMMPVLDGFEAIQIMKANPGTATIPIIAVTALSRPTDREHALSSGAEDYISKPFDLDKLITMIGNLLLQEENG